MRTRWLPWTLCLTAMLAPLPATADPPADPGSLLQQARAHQALAQYDEAADAYEKVARGDLAAAEAPRALFEAIVLRLGLGQMEGARADAALFTKEYGAKEPGEASRVGLAMAKAYVDREDWARASGALGAWVAAFDRGAPLDNRIVAHAMLGRTLVKLDQEKEAASEYGLVRDLWKDPAAAAIAIAPEGAPGRDRRLATALNAVGEALFFFAEQQRRGVEKIRFPEYRGPDTQEAVAAHLRSRVKDWVALKRPAIEEAERAYAQVLHVEPAAPPRWVIASAARVGQMWGKFVAEFRAAPIPAKWKGHGPVAGGGGTFDQLRLAYYRALDEGSAPQKQQAKAAFDTCVAYSVKYQYSDELSRTCNAWLSRNYPGQYLALDELMPRSGLLGDASFLTAPLAEPLGLASPP